jgi:hypothetical protein
LSPSANGEELAEKQSAKVLHAAWQLAIFGRPLLELELLLLLDELPLPLELLLLDELPLPEEDDAEEAALELLPVSGVIHAPSTQIRSPLHWLLDTQPPAWFGSAEQPAHARVPSTNAAADEKKTRRFAVNLVCIERANHASNDVST